MLQVQMNYLFGDGALARCAARGTAFMHKRLSPPMVLILRSHIAAGAVIIQLGVKVRCVARARARPEP